MRVLILAMLAAALCCFGCDFAKESADTTEGAGETAVGVAETMSGGTVGDADMDSGEVAEETDSDAELYEEGDE
jgi:hypothetical protein